MLKNIWTTVEAYFSKDPNFFKNIYEGFKNWLFKETPKRIVLKYQNYIKEKRLLRNYSELIDNLKTSKPSIDSLNKLDFECITGESTPEIRSLLNYVDRVLEKDPKWKSLKPIKDIFSSNEKVYNTIKDIIENIDNSTGEEKIINKNKYMDIREYIIMINNMLHEIHNYTGKGN